MKKVLNTCLLLSSFIGYLEWGQNRHAFICQVEYEVFFQKAQQSADAVSHPFILIPLAGQLLLLFSLFQKTPGRFLSLAGLACLSLIMLFLLLIGLMSLNLNIAVSTLPFIIIGVLVLKNQRKPKKIISILKNQ